MTDDYIDYNYEDSVWKDVADDGWKDVDGGWKEVDDYGWTAVKAEL